MTNRAHIKSELRSGYLRKREEILIQQKSLWDALIFKRLINLKSYLHANTIHLYVSSSKKNEVDTFQIIHHSLSIGKKVVVPKVVSDGLLKHIAIKSTNDLKENRWGILEPEDGEEVKIGNLNLIIVPMVAGDRQRNRLGYGKGFYDRFLGNSNAFKIGLLYDLQIHPEKLPIEKFDIPLDLLLTQTEQI